MMEDKAFNKLKKLCNDAKVAAAADRDSSLTLEQFQELLTILVKAREKTTAAPQAE